jgi:hypothetical protein
MNDQKPWYDMLIQSFDIEIHVASYICNYHFLNLKFYKYNLRCSKTYNTEEQIENVEINCKKIIYMALLTMHLRHHGLYLFTNDNE